MSTSNDPNQAWINGIENVVNDLRLSDAEIRSTNNLAKLRRSSHETDDSLVEMAVVERNGIIYLEDASYSAIQSNTLRKGDTEKIRPGKTLTRSTLERLPPSKVYEKLEKADRKLTPMSSDGDKITGLRSLKNGAFKPEIAAAPKGRILLFVHGTFSNSDNVIEKLLSTPDGTAFLKQAQTKYDQILAFDHRTLGVSPTLNAVELSTFFDRSDAEVDIICHSRGGLVSRWWAEVFDKKVARKVRVICVGSPMAGTSLASPHNIRESMNLLANYSRMAGFLATTCPLFTVATVFFEAISSITRVVAKTPVADAAIALVPGLDAMSRVGNNHELLTLQKTVSTRPDHRYFAVQSNFEPDAVGWNFWKVFRNGKDKLKNAAADFVFQNDNDLVVDTVSMTQIPGFEKGSSFDFGTNGRVHHTNYFEQPKTATYFGETLLK